MEDLSTIRRLSPIPSGEAFLEQLPDSLIQEILLRLPLSSVFRSRCVCKLWYSLTTSPDFIRRRELHALFRQDPPLALLLQDSCVGNQRDFFFCSGVPEVKLSGFFLDFLFGFCSHITVIGSCDDLLLCCNGLDFQSVDIPINYFVVNPITHQWIVLPPTLPWQESVIAGFACEPASVSWARKGGELRYRVVHIPVFKESKTELNVEIFSSEDGQWNEYVMTLAEGLRTNWLSQRGLACNGILYWQFNSGGVNVIRLDPFNPKENGIRLIQNSPDMFNLEPKKYVLVICQGKLKMCEMLSPSSQVKRAIASYMNIWELDDAEAKWQLVEEVSILEILYANSLILHSKNGVGLSLVTLALHPSNEDIIYLEYCHKNICCNLKKMSIEIVSDYIFNKSYFSFPDVFPFVLPWWPTPIPALPKLQR